MYNDKMFVVFVVGFFILIIVSFSMDKYIKANKNAFVKKIKVTGFQLECLGELVLSVILILMFIVGNVFVLKEHLIVSVLVIYITGVIMILSYSKTLAEYYIRVDLGVDGSSKEAGRAAAMFVCPVCEIYVFLGLYMNYVLKVDMFPAINFENIISADGYGMAIFICILTKILNLYAEGRRK